MKTLKRIIGAVIYALVGGLGGGMGAVAGSAPKAFTLGTRLGVMGGGVVVLGIVVMAAVIIIVDIILGITLGTFGGIIGKFLNEEAFELVLMSVETFLVAFFSIVIVLSVSCFLKYAVRGAAMGMVRGARGGALGGRLGGAINGMAEGALCGFGFGMIVSCAIELFFKFFKKSKEGFYGEDFWWVLAFTLFSALLGLIIGASNGTEKYALKNIPKNDSLKNFFRYIFKYALRGARLNGQEKIWTAQELKALRDRIFLSPLRFRIPRNERCDDPGNEK
jgi:hypothetical protein